MSADKDGVLETLKEIGRRLYRFYLEPTGRLSIIELEPQPGKQVGEVDHTRLMVFFSEGSGMTKFLLFCDQR